MKKSEKPVEKIIDEHHKSVKDRVLAELKKLNKEIEKMVK